VKKCLELATENSILFTTNKKLKGPTKFFISTTNCSLQWRLVVNQNHSKESNSMN